MAETSLSPGQSRSRTVKLALIPVLSTILAVVLWNGEEEPLELRTEASATPSEKPDPQDKEETSDSPLFDLETQALPEIELANLLQHDPFALPKSMRPTPPEEEENSPPVSPVALENDLRIQRMQEITNRLKDKRATLYYRDHKGPIAVIDSRPYREGDLFELGIRIGEISSQGVRMTTDEADPTTNLKQN